jgi:hypothetical protein
MLPPEVTAEMAQLLQALQSPDNNIRSQAEEHLQNNWTSTRPEILLMGLAEQVSAATEVTVCFLDYVHVDSHGPLRTMTSQRTLSHRAQSLIGIP